MILTGPTLKDRVYDILPDARHKAISAKQISSMLPGSAPNSVTLACRCLQRFGFATCISGYVHDGRQKRGGL